jgi:hypothetical protein
MQSVRKQAITVGSIFAIDVAALVICSGIPARI